MAAHHRKVRLSALLTEFIKEPIEKLTTSSGSNPGDNVVGKMLSIQVTTKSGEIKNLVVKALVPFNEKDIDDTLVSEQDKRFANVVSKFCPFKLELNYYNRIKPGIDEEFRGSYSLPSPQLFYGLEGGSGNGVDDILILEDLRPRGYKMANKFSGLTSEEFHMVLEKLARFHAASHVYLSTYPESVEKYAARHCYSLPKFMNFCNEGHDQFMSEIYFGFLVFAKDAGKISEDTFTRIMKLTETMSPRDIIISSLEQALKDYFPVYTHGDLWVNNVLFSYNGQGKPVDIRFIDFQQCRRGSIYDDLYYFIYTSTTREFREKYLEKELNYYFDTFVETIQELKGNLTSFSRETFHHGYRKYLRVAFCNVVMAIAFQQGIAPANNNTSDDEPVGVNSKHVEANEMKGNEIGETSAAKSESCLQLEKYAVEVLTSVRKAVLSGAMNSPIALQRLKDLCDEMEQMNVF